MICLVGMPNLGTINTPHNSLHLLPLSPQYENIESSGYIVA